LDIELAFITLYQRIREDPWFKNTTILYLIENNFGNDCSWLYNLMKKSATFDNVYMLSERPQQKLGFCTGELSKMEGFFILQKFAGLSAIRFYKGLITFNAKHTNGRVAMRSLLIEQMSQIKMYTTRNGVSTKTFITAILDENKKRLKLVDDVLIAFIIFLYNSTRFFQKQLDCPYETIYGLSKRVRHYNETTEFFGRMLDKSIIEKDKEKQEIDRTGLFNI
jgi:hypothetical protein